MASGQATALSITRDHLARIERMDWAGPRVNSIIEVNPDAERSPRAGSGARGGHVRGPLHGIPIVLKDVIATADRMETTAGSLALVGSNVPAGCRRRDAPARGRRDPARQGEHVRVERLPRVAEPGWVERVERARTQPVRIEFSTGDSSSGSAAAVAASFAAGAVGLETYGSIVMPSSLCGVVGLKPTPGLVESLGDDPISFTRDAIGPIARTVTDVASCSAAWSASTRSIRRPPGSDGHSQPDYGRFLDQDGLRGARIGVWRRQDLWRTTRWPSVSRARSRCFESGVPR